MFCEYSTMYLYTLMLMDIGVVFSFGLLWRQLLWTFVYMYFGERVYVLFVIYLEVRMLSHKYTYNQFCKILPVFQGGHTKLHSASRVQECYFLPGPESLFSIISLLSSISACAQDNISWSYLFSSIPCQMDQNILQHSVIWCTFPRSTISESAWLVSAFRTDSGFSKCLSTAYHRWTFCSCQYQLPHCTLPDH